MTSSNYKYIFIFSITYTSFSPSFEIFSYICLVDIFQLMGRFFFFILFSVLFSVSLSSQNRRANRGDLRAFIEYTDENDSINYYTTGGIKRQDFARSTKIVCAIDPLDNIYKVRMHFVVQSFNSQGLTEVICHADDCLLSDELKRKIMNQKNKVYISVTCYSADWCPRGLPPIEIDFANSTNKYRSMSQIVNKN